MLDVVGGDIQLDAGSGGATNLLIRRGGTTLGSISSTDSQFTISALNNKDIRIWDDSNNGIIVKDGGYVGIGTSAPSQLFDIWSGGSQRFYVDTNGWVGLAGIYNNDGDASGPTYGFGSDHSTGMFSPGTGMLGFSTNGIERLRLGNNGYVGLGTTSPIAKLDVYGDIAISGSNRYLNFGSATGTIGYGLRDNAGTIEIKNNAGDWATIGGGTVASGTTGWIPYYSGYGSTLTPTSSLYIPRTVISV